MRELLDRNNVINRDVLEESFFDEKG